MIKEHSKIDITIGKPIANTQIYILDDTGHICPIGVAGELCIAGDGVGKGYLNNPELTAEKFVPNPFATAENGHGKVMYRTGDLARWREDGEIEYLGRIDTQVKIRGLRIELGEIESVMSTFPNIGLTAAAARKDANGRQYLVGYYTVNSDAGIHTAVSDEPYADVSNADGYTGGLAADKMITDDNATFTLIDEKALRKHLSDKLPKYMVPNYFVCLDEMPMTPSGKTDRKNLPTPEMNGAPDRMYVAPVGELETRLCAILADIFGIGQVSAEDDFFDDLGGDSLRAITYVSLAHESDIELGLQAVFDFPTVRALSKHLLTDHTHHISYDAADFDKYNTLLDRNILNPNRIYAKTSLGNTLLTGATGFLGSHILDQFIKSESGILYCLVRGRNEADSTDRLRDILRYYFGDKYDALIGERIIPVCGDITSDALSDAMPADINTVIHTAATVKHFGAYEYFHRINTVGTKHIVDYAKNTGARLIHISTIGVSGNSMADDMSVCRVDEGIDFDERNLYVGQPLDNVYVRSKFEAERLILDESLDGLKAHIIRVGNLTNRSTDFHFQPNYETNAFLKRMKAILTLGVIPDYLMPLYSEFSPVDLTAAGVILLAQYAECESVFHLYSNKPLYFSQMIPMLNEMGIRIDAVDADTFYRALDQSAADPERRYIYEALHNDLDVSGRLMYDTNIHIKNDFTVDFLKNTGFEWNEIDDTYVRGYIEYFRKCGYLNI